MATLVCQPCQNDDLEVEAAGYCVDCGEYLCAMCYKYHCKPQPCRHHVLLDKDSMPREPSANTQVMETCEKHKGKALEYYCNAHDFVGCSVCMTLDHTTCEGKNYIPDIAMSIPDSDEYKQLQTDIGELTKSVDEQINDIGESLLETEKRHDETVADVLCFRQKLDEAIDSLENVVRDEIQILKERNTKSEKEKIKSVQNIKAEIDKIGSELDMSIRYRQFLKLFIAMKNAKSVTSDIHERLKDFQTNADIKFEFTPNMSILKLLNALETLGTVSAVRLDNIPVKQNVKMDTSSESGPKSSDQTLIEPPPSPKTKSILKSSAKKQELDSHVDEKDCTPLNEERDIESKTSKISNVPGEHAAKVDLSSEQTCDNNKSVSSENNASKIGANYQETETLVGANDMTNATNITNNAEVIPQNNVIIGNQSESAVPNVGDDQNNSKNLETTIQYPQSTDSDTYVKDSDTPDDKNTTPMATEHKISNEHTTSCIANKKDKAETKEIPSSGFRKYMLSHSDSDDAYDEGDEEKPSSVNKKQATQSANSTSANIDTQKSVGDSGNKTIKKLDKEQIDDVSNKDEMTEEGVVGEKKESTKVEAAAKVKITNPKERVVVFLKDIVVTSTDDVGVPSVTGMASLNDDKIVVCDNENKLVKIVDILSNIVQQTIKTDQCPWDVCETDSDKLAVTFPFSKQITIYAMSNQGSYKKDYSFSAEGACYGITYANENLFVTYGDANVVKVMDLYGYVLRTLQNARGEKCIFSGPKHITTGPEGRLFYVANWENNSVTCLTVLGHVAGIFTDRDLKAPRGIAVDSFGLVYVSNYLRPSCVQVLTKGLNKVKKLLNKDKNVVNPLSLVYSVKGDWLFIGLRGNSVKMYKLTV